MTHHSAPSTPLFFVPTVLACVAAAVLSACGGADPAAVEDGTVLAEPSIAVDDRQFALWAEGEDTALKAEQRLLDPGSDGSTVQLIVRLNPAAAVAGDRTAALGSAGNGESGDAAALRASRLAAKANAVATAAQSVLSQSVLRLSPGAEVRQQFSHAVEGFVVSVPWAQAQAVAAELARNPAVDAVEPDRLFKVGQAGAAVRTLDSRAWGVDRIDQRSRVFDNSFRQTLTGSGVNVYVVDTGVSPHNEFGGRLVPGFSAINDGRGTTDCHGHGTHVAGTAAGATVGVAPAARVVPVRVMTCAGSSSGSSVLAGLDWVAAYGTRPGVVNMSLGGGASSTLDTATQRLMTAGFSVVAAAGNDNADACTQSPGRAAGLVTVAASDRVDAKASFSNWGNCVALWAPGTAIGSAGYASTSAVVMMNGTSMAAPHATGAAALLLQGQPTLAPAPLRELLLAQASAQTVTGVPGGMTRSLLFAGDAGGTPAAPVTPPPPPPPVLVRSITMTSMVPAVGAWTAAASVLVVDAKGQPVGGAQVTGRYSNSPQDLLCTTAASGLCTLTSVAAPWATVPALGMAVTQVKAPGMAYTGGGVSTAQVLRPAPPVASVSLLTGTMLRSSPKAVEWVPQFSVTLKDDRGALVADATVQAVLRAHAGAGVVAAATVTCRTSANGECKLNWVGPKLTAVHTGAAVQVLGAERTYLAYKAGAVTQASVGTVR